VVCLQAAALAASVNPSPLTVKLVKDINLSASGPAPSELVALNGLVFFTADDGTNGTELWRSDGTAAGTVMVKDIAPGLSESSNPSKLTAMGNTLFFMIPQTSTRSLALWKSDGTEAGTVRVKDIVPGVGGSSPSGLNAVGNTLFFAADDGIHGRELWQSDGTEAGTVLAAEIFPGTTGSEPHDLTAFGGKLFFAATHPLTGLELWVAFADADGDGVPNDEDHCPSSDLGPAIVIQGCDSGLVNRLLGNGCTLADRVALLIAESARGARNHGQFVSRVVHGLNELTKTGLITGPEQGAIQSCATRSKAVR